MGFQIGGDLWLFHPSKLALAGTSATQFSRSTLELTPLKSRKEFFRVGNAKGSHLVAFWLQERKKNDVADRLCASQEHGQSIDPDSYAAGWRHSVLERE